MPPTGVQYFPYSRRSGDTSYAGEAPWTHGLNPRHMNTWASVRTIDVLDREQHRSDFIPESAGFFEPPRLCHERILVLLVVEVRSRVGVRSDEYARTKRVQVQICRYVACSDTQSCEMFTVMLVRLHRRSVDIASCPVSGIPKPRRLALRYGSQLRIVGVREDTYPTQTGVFC